MPENYARETNVKNAKDCRNSQNSGKASNKSASNEVSNKAPVSKQNAAHRKAEDCDR